MKARQLSRSIWIPVLWLAACGSADPELGPTWQELISSPSVESLTAMQKQVEACADDSVCLLSRRPDSSEISMLVGDVRVGKERSLAVAFVAQRTIASGGDAEDLCRSIGSRVSSSPAEFLTLVRQHRQDPCLLTMLPLGSGDDPGLERRLVRERLDAIESVGDPALNSEQDWALRVLRRRLERVPE